MNPRRLKAYTYLLVVAVIWGAAGPVIKFTLSGIAPLPFLAYRFSIAAIFSIVYFVVSGNKIPNPKKTLLLLVIYGLLAYTLSLNFLFAGLAKTTVLDLTLITQIGPLMIAVASAIFFRDHITRREKLGIAIVFTGSMFTALVPLISDSHSTAKLSGNIFILLFLLAETGGVLWAKKLTRMQIPPLVLINFGFIVAAITTLAVAAAAVGPTQLATTIGSLPLKYHAGVTYMALISGTLAYFLEVSAQKAIEVSEAILFRYLQPLVGVPLAIVWLGEQITTYFVIGTILVSSGIVIAEVKKKR
ncbi:hypothetical protein A3F62_04965 [Candidatus Woesebacteria bacterium RIFCSPHIGHO2_12_FULL_44_11]|uniref:EamA domain-containing protein n=1 Tax=Candidatus Woesebacteria bacterium RIFCSPLOWO2_01_FULL_44_14 TaxID=1802525 RepID=A0A1F8C3J7_9BACT|nr:MAG: hypothetical protein A3F62_04965 [Candidatus Woesebacteria bacterium RIFCSPHIGHO2_12_FULL_44_11]OGM70854.1 MAG: hypothetical protein A2975_01090 [Candidatus Woesebacteria bacterium RIFCSPLOWO2_01_FULL_44_14]